MTQTPYQAHLFESPTKWCGSRGETISGGAAQVCLQDAQLLDRKFYNAPSSVLGPAGEGSLEQFDPLELSLSSEMLTSFRRDKNVIMNQEVRDAFSDAIVEVFRKNSAMFVEAHFPLSGPAMFDARSKLGEDFPIFVVGHAWEYLSHREPKDLRLSAELECLRDADLVIVNTRHEAGEISRLYDASPAGVNRIQLRMLNPDFQLSASEILQKLRVVPLGVNPDVFSPEIRISLRNAQREELAKLIGTEISDQDLIIGSFGRVAAQKNQLGTVEIFSEVTDKYPNLPVRLVIAGHLGDDDYGTSVKSAIKDLAPVVQGRVHLLGSYGSDFMSWPDIVIDSSVYETWGLATQQLGALGLPVVAAANPVYQELYSDKVPLFDSKDGMVEAVALLVQDLNMRKSLGQDWATATHRFSWETRGESLINTVEDKGFAGVAASLASLRLLKLACPA